jgi:DNA-directed RNA polymerase subunit beta
MVLNALEYTKTPAKYKMYDSVSNRWVYNPIAVGWMYFFKMIHIAETKLAGRGIGSYNKRTLQPLGGRKNRGGQRYCPFYWQDISSYQKCSRARRRY